MDDDDPAGGRGVPSRTLIGKKASIVAKFPHLGAPRYLLGGLIRLPEYGYMHTSVAKLELMMADLPHIAYRTPKERPRITQRQADEAYQRSLQMREALKHGGLPLNLGKRISLGEMLAKSQ